MRWSIEVLYHGETGRVDVVVLLSRRLFLVSLGAVLLGLCFLLLLALALLELELGALLAVACSLVVQLVVFGGDFALAGVAVATTASAGRNGLVKSNGE